MTPSQNPVNVVAARFGIPASAVKEVVSLPLNALRERDTFPLPNAFVPTTPIELPLGSVRITRADSEAYVGILREVDPRQLRLSEEVGNIREHPTYQLYRKWAGEGREAPPIAVFEGENGQWTTCNRRRTLVHQELGLSLKAWFEPLNAETGLPLKIQDIKDAYEQALQLNPRAPADQPSAAP